VTRGNDDVETSKLPEGGVWRIGPATDPYEIRPPLSPEDLNSPKTGNRFDSPVGNYSVVYFATKLEGCFGETLARCRPDPTLPAAFQGEWSTRGFMLPGEIPADWRHRRLAVRARAAMPGAIFSTSNRP
jgi:hypothetical protein